MHAVLNYTRRHMLRHLGKISSNYAINHINHKNRTNYCQPQIKLVSEAQLTLRFPDQMVIIHSEPVSDP